MDTDILVSNILANVRSLELIQPRDDRKYGDYNFNEQTASGRCSPHIEFTEGSCFSIEALIKMVKVYNKKHPDSVIDYKGKGKKDLWNELQKKFNTVCDKDESCWIKQPQFEEEELEEYFKPNIPKKKYQWLSNFDIDGVMRQYEKKYPFFLYLGTSPIDFDEYIKEIKNLDVCKLYNMGVRCVGNIFNTDRSTGRGEHWIAFFCDLRDLQDLKYQLGAGRKYDKFYSNKKEKSKTVEFFDSYGLEPPKEIDVLMKRVGGQFNSCKKEKLEYKVNNIRWQYGGSECGVYCLYFITERLDGVPFNVLTGYKIGDKQMNEKRKEFFKI